MKKIVTIEIPLVFEDDDEILSLPNEKIAERIEETVVVEMSVGEHFEEQHVTVKDV